jgi:hypothetical protein
MKSEQIKGNHRQSYGTARGCAQGGPQRGTDGLSQGHRALLLAVIAAVCDRPSPFCVVTWQGRTVLVLR